LFNGDPRKKKFMGHDATMEVGGTLTVSVDAQSSKYKDLIEKEIVNPNVPLINYRPGQKNVDAVTTASEKYFADRGLAYTFRSGKRVNTTTLHIAEWLNAIRNGGTLSCNIDQGFEEAITAHMATISFKEGKKVYWDRKTETIS
jgi:hypothetical protein